MSDPSALPNSCQLRPACANDSWQIRKLVLFAKLDPTQLRWSQFWVIECDQQIVACGQLRSFENAQELGSLVVSRAWRGKGFGRLLTQHLIDIATQPLYLECLGDRLSRFYAQFGFAPVDWDELPDSLKRKFGLSKRATQIFHIPLHIMAYEPSSQ